MEDYVVQAGERMEKTLEQLQANLNTVRTGRANPTLLDRVEVDYYGTPTPVNQISSITVSEGRTLVIKPYDASSLKDIERAINASDVNLPPNNDGTVIRLTVPQLTEETRKGYCKDVAKFAEEAKVAIRNIRRDINDTVKKEKSIPEDLSKDLLDQVQKATDKYISRVDEIAKAKEKEIMTI
ncbi:MAG: ribosome recycling factor [Erysipelotrichaceae bacterium]|jgi:ribosome recycling factor|nr:ribosome recycling factor [Erysipelotrichaceae bacterium]